SVKRQNTPTEISILKPDFQKSSLKFHRYKLGIENGKLCRFFG
ncbi:unnamed protein product, partial [marine sediment metagenome]